MSFTVGQMVRVREDLVGGNSYNGLFFAPEMEEYRGSVRAIKDADVGEITGYYELVGIDGWTFNDAMLEPYEEPAEVATDESVMVEDTGDEYIPETNATNATLQWDDIVSFLYYENYKDYQFVFDTIDEFKEWLESDRPRPSVLKDYEVALLKSLSNLERPLSYYAIAKNLRNDYNWFAGVCNFNATVNEILSNYKPYEE